jgi:peptidoglycan/LPS O-acetylase OafA/YrhL
MFPENQLQNLNKEQYGGLDFLRTIAILMVFIFHYQGGDFNDLFLGIKDFGWTGVDLFFVLSGFLIAKQLFAEANTSNKISIKKFYIKRAFRILPAYFFILAIYYFVPIFRESPVLSPLYRYLTFTQNIGLNPRINNAFTHCWSLCVEEQFYILFPLILLLFCFYKMQKKVFYLIAVLFIFTILIRIFLWNSFVDPIKNPFAIKNNIWVTWIYYPTYARLDGLLTGITIAGIFEYLPKWKTWLQTKGNTLLVIGISIVVVAFYVCKDRFGFTANAHGFQTVALGYGFIVLSAICPSSILYKINFRFFKTIAILSYAMYLCHKGICHICQTYFEELGFNEEGNFMLLICLAATIFSAVLIRYLIEKPFLKCRDSLLLSLNL